MGKGAAAGLVNDIFVSKRVQLGDCVVAGFATDEEATQGSTGADAESRRVVLGAVEFPRGEGGEVRTVAFSSMIDGIACGAKGVEETLKPGDQSACGGDVVA